MEPRQYFACARKFRYRSKARAQRALTLIRRTGKIIPPEANVYHCRFCHGWHTGHKPKGKTGGE